MAKGNKRALLTALATAVVGTLAAYSPWAPQARATGEVPSTRKDGPVAVSLGDSFISGEAGRWWGNADILAAAVCTRGGTDRAAYRDKLLICHYDPKKVYGDTAVDPEHIDTTGCHRSDVAEITGTRQIGLTPVNLACSGAETEHILSDPFKENKKSQAQLLQQVATAHQAKLIVVSIGGNDLNVSGLLEHCVDQYMDKKPSCASSGEGKRLLDQLPKVETNVGKVIDKIRQVMKSAGSSPGNYKLILQSYPSPVPTSAKVRSVFSEAGGGMTSRTLAGGCPLWNADFDLMHDTLAPAIDTMLKKVAADKNVTFLSMLHALDGHALCENGTRQAGPTEEASKLGSQLEWVRYGTLGWKISQGYRKESLHPNAFAQQFQGRCLAAAYKNSALTQTCSAAT